MRKIIPIIILTILICAGCARTKYVEVPVTTTKTEYVTKEKVMHDSVYYHDSVYVAIIGETIHVTQFKDRYVYKYINKTDTVSKDSIVEKPVYIGKEVEVDRLTMWQRILIFFGITFIIYIIYIVAKKK